MQMAAEAIRVMAKGDYYILTSVIKICTAIGLLSVLEAVIAACHFCHVFCIMEETLKRLKEEAELVGLRININKTKGIRVNTSTMQKFRLEETEIEEVGSFVYLGSVVSESGGTEEDVASRIKKANGVFVQLDPVWRNLNISKEVKI
jgi:hypothetical protein